MSETIDQELNKRERYKAALKPYDYFPELETLDFESLGEGDRFYLQDFGIFNTDFLEDEFTIRLRVAGGRIDVAQLYEIAKIVTDYDLTLVLTARGGLQLHDVEADTVLEIWHQLNDKGLTTWQSFGDNVRNIVCDVYDGVGQSSELEVYPLIVKMQEYILKNPKYVGMLPRRVSIGISGNRSTVNSFFANDIYFALAKKEAQFGFNVYMGGKNSEVAQSADIFLLYDEVFDFFKAFIEMFYTHGSRFSRSKTRLFYMIESKGMQEVVSLIETYYKRAFQSAGEIVLEHRDFQTFEQLKDGSYAYCYESDFGRLSSKELQMIADFASKESLEVRFGMDQNIYLLGLKEPKVPFESPALSATILACAGNLCPYSAWSIKNETAYLPLERLYKHHIRVGFSGCAKGCGRHRHTDIGLIGLKTNHFGATDGGARIFLGALHNSGTAVGRQIFALVPFEHLHSVVSLMITLFEAYEYQSFERYAKEVLHKFSEHFIALWHLYNLKNHQSLPLPLVAKPLSSAWEKEALVKHFEGVEFVDDRMDKTVSQLSKELWTIEGKDPTYKPPIIRTAVR